MMKCPICSADSEELYKVRVYYPEGTHTDYYVCAVCAEGYGEVQ